MGLLEFDADVFAIADYAEPVKICGASFRHIEKFIRHCRWRRGRARMWSHQCETGDVLRLIGIEHLEVRNGEIRDRIAGVVQRLDI